jgi:hypothetical protein
MKAVPAFMPPPGGPDRDVDLPSQPRTRALRRLIQLVAVRFANDHQVDVCWRTIRLSCIPGRPRTEYISRLNARQPGQLLSDNLTRTK